MSSEFNMYVSSGSTDKLKAYIKCKKAGTIILYHITKGEENGTILMVQVTNLHTLESARKIKIRTSNLELKKTIKMINYRTNEEKCPVRNPHNL